jgi:hypothetical protein
MVVLQVLSSSPCFVEQIAEPKVKLLSLHASITEMLIAMRSDVGALNVSSAEQPQQWGSYGISGRVSTVVTNHIDDNLQPSAVANAAAELSSKLTSLILKMVRLHHRFVTLSEIVLAETKILDSPKAKERRNGASTLIAGKFNGNNSESILRGNRLNPDGTPRVSQLSPAQQEKAQQETAKVISRLAHEAENSPLKSYFRILLDVPDSSDEGMVINGIIMACIFFSVFMLFWQTMVSHSVSCALAALS